MTNPKWETGRVKLADGTEAFIDAINEDQEDWRYTGRVRSHRGIMVSAGWHANGRYMYAETNHGYNLAPPPKKKVRVRASILVYRDGSTSLYRMHDTPSETAKRNAFALLEIDREIEEGEGL